MFWITFSILATTMIAGNVRAMDVNCALPPPRVNLSVCCTAPLLTTGIGEKCSSRTNSGGPMPDLCFGECIFNETGLAVNGIVQMNKARAILTERLKAVPEFVPVVEQALMKCEKLAQEKISSKSSQPGPPIKLACNPLPALTALCTMTESFANCPESRWQNTEACNAARQHMKMCPMLSRAPPS